MRLGRVTCGIVAGAVGILCMFALNALEAHFLGHATRGSLWLGLMGGGSAVLWLADRLGILASAYSEPTLGLGRSIDDEKDDRAPKQGWQAGPLRFGRSD